MITFEKTWQFVMNTYLAPSSTRARDLLFFIKNTLKGFASTPWTVVYSCSSTVAGTAGDGVDRWAAGSNIVFAGADSTAHSWIVLKQTGIASNFQMLINCVGPSSTSAGYASFFVSPSAGFTGGATNARPTATDEHEITPIDQWSIVSFDSTKPSYVHIAMSTDGECTRVIWMQDRFVGSIWIIDKIKSPRAQIIHPYAALVRGSTSENAFAATYAILNEAAAMRARGGSAGTTLANVFMTASMLANSPIGQLLVAANDVGSEFVLSPVGLYSATASATGRYGRLFDLWWAPSSIEQGGDFDGTKNYKLAKLGPLLFPSNGDRVKVK